MSARCWAAIMCLSLGLTTTSCKGTFPPSSSGIEHGGETSAPRGSRTRPWPSHAELTNFALAHVERLGLLAGAKDREEFALLYRPVVFRASLCHPDGAWDVTFYAKEDEAAVRIYLASNGQLLGFENYWPYLSAKGAEDRREEGEPMEEALARSIEAIKSIRGDFPDDLVLAQKEAVLHGAEPRGYDVYHRTPYWDFRWRQYDGDIEYAVSWVHVVISKRDGVVKYIDQYLGLRTRHTPKITRQEALARARSIVEETILPDFTDVANWDAGCSEHPMAYVWKVPGSEGDSLAYLCGWVVNDRVGMFFVDATTGQKIGVNMTPSWNWRFEGEE